LEDSDAEVDLQLIALELEEEGNPSERESVNFTILKAF
jgi:hypothetical protein